MTISIGKYEFEGPHRNASHIRPESGVVLTFGNTLEDEDCWSVVDIVAADDVQHRLVNHDRWQYWREQEVSQLGFAVLYCDATSREAIERELRESYQPPCGNRETSTSVERSK